MTQMSFKTLKVFLQAHFTDVNTPILPCWNLKSFKTLKVFLQAHFSDVYTPILPCWNRKSFKTLNVFFQAHFTLFRSNVRETFVVLKQGPKSWRVSPPKKKMLLGMIVKWPFVMHTPSSTSFSSILKCKWKHLISHSAIYSFQRVTFYS